MAKDVAKNNLKNDNFVIPECVYGYKADNYGATGLYQVSSESTELAEGVTYYRKHYNNKDHKNVDVYITAVSGDSEATFGVYAAEFDTTKDVFNSVQMIPFRNQHAVLYRVQDEAQDLFLIFNASSAL